MAAGLRQDSADGLLFQAVERICLVGGIALALKQSPQADRAGSISRSGGEQDRFVQTILSSRILPGQE